VRAKQKCIGVAWVGEGGVLPNTDAVVSIVDEIATQLFNFRKGLIGAVDRGFGMLRDLLEDYYEENVESEEEESEDEEDLEEDKLEELVAESAEAENYEEWLVESGRMVEGPVVARKAPQARE
jgi:hypothetical protein